MPQEAGKGGNLGYHCGSAECARVLVSDDVSGEEFPTFRLTVLPSMRYGQSKRWQLLAQGNEILEDLKVKLWGSEEANCVYLYLDC